MWLDGLPACLPARGWYPTSGPALPEAGATLAGRPLPGTCPPACLPACLPEDGIPLAGRPLPEDGIPLAVRCFSSAPYT